MDQTEESIRELKTGYLKTGYEGQKERVIEGKKCMRTLEEPDIYVNWEY